MARRLHIGGEVKSEGWEVLNANPAPHVDHVCNANDLSQFADGTFTEIYASHVVEHLDYSGELQATLKEWNRVLVPGGKVSISVPDLDVLAKLMLDRSKLTVDDRFLVMRMIFGGHLDKHDYHVVGLNEEFLTGFLVSSGYVKIRRVQEFGLFDDTSSMPFKGVPISLNMIAEKRDNTEAIGRSDVNATGRNQPCSCGSGRKFKHCHGKLA
jgi:predicted SAM-dependent methyltransferase